MITKKCKGKPNRKTVFRIAMAYISFCLVSCLPISTTQLTPSTQLSSVVRYSLFSLIFCYVLEKPQNLPYFDFLSVSPVLQYKHFYSTSIPNVLSKAKTATRHTPAKMLVVACHNDLQHTKMSREKIDFLFYIINLFTLI